MYASHKKRVKRASFDQQEYERQKATMSAEEFYPTTDTLLHGSAPLPTKEQMARLRDDLEKTFVIF